MLIFPKLVEEKQSKFNGTIQVYKLFGKYSISVDNLTQSGGLLVPIWRKALKKIQNTKYDIHHTLVLGLGGGSAAKLVRQFWPEAKITAIEIDPVMIQLAKKYHGVDKIKNLKIITADAFKFTREQENKRTREQHDLILIDTYQGKKYPQEAKTPEFFNQLKKLLTPQGIVIFNRLNWADNDKDIQQHIKLLRQHFLQVTSKKILSNTLVFCSSSR